jgi:orotidine-5'-phosphate decarboxylase
MTSPVFCPIDVPDLAAAQDMSRKVAPHVGGLKLGLEFFVANGPSGVREIAKLGKPIFLDLKLHDIPNTVAGAVRSAAELGIEYLTIHTSGGPAMLKAAAEAAAGRVKLLGVSVLTSLDDADLVVVGQQGPVATQVGRLAKLAQECGLDGLICSPVEIALVRMCCGTGFTLMVPGIRPPGSDAGDQKRVMTPAEAMKAGADWLVIGRPITAAPDPAEAARAINAGLEGIAA